MHLTNGIKPAYYQNADYVFLQTGFDKTPVEIEALVKQAIAVTKKPVILAEYSKESRSADAKRLGDIGCKAGAVGTGNGRNITLCGQQEPKKSKSSSSDAIVTVVGVAAVGALLWYLYTSTVDEGVIITFQYDDSDDYQIGLKNQFQLSEDSSFTLRLDHMKNLSTTDQAIQLQYEKRF